MLRKTACRSGRLIFVPVFGTEILAAACPGWSVSGVYVYALYSDLRFALKVAHARCEDFTEGQKDIVVF